MSARPHVDEPTSPPGRATTSDATGSSADISAVTSSSAGRPASVVLGATLSAVYSLGLLWFGLAALTVLFRTGGWGDRNAAKGMVFVGVLGLLGAACLIGGAVRT